MSPLYLPYIKAREIAQLRSQLGLPRGAAAKVSGDVREISAEMSGIYGEVWGGLPNPTLILTVTVPLIGAGEREILATRRQPRRDGRQPRRQVRGDMGEM